MLSSSHPDLTLKTKTPIVNTSNMNGREQSLWGIETMSKTRGTGSNGHYSAVVR